MQVAKGDHVIEAIFSPIFKPAAPAKLRRILERAEKHVPDRQV
jgi:hypothetical protein